MSASTPSISPVMRGSIALALATTLLFGVGLRWVLAGRLTMTWEFADLRHAHSHLGYFGVLFPLAWIGWSRAGAIVPGRIAMGIYSLATAVAFLGFLRAGYGPDAIVGCTVVGAVWLVSAWRIRRRMGTLNDPLAVMLPGVLMALGCIAPIAYFLRRDAELAHGFVNTFLSVLLLVVIVPSALTSREVRVGPWPLLLASGGLAAAALGVWPSWPARLGMVVYAIQLCSVVFHQGLAHHLRAVWGMVGIGLLALALGLLPNTRPVALGAIHFCVLAPVLGTLAAEALPRNPPVWVWLTNHAAVAVMSGALVAQAFGAGAWTWTVAAASGTLVAFVWFGVLGLQVGSVRGMSVGT